jgi:hypothetical protein
MRHVGLLTSLIGLIAGAAPASAQRAWQQGVSGTIGVLHTSTDGTGASLTGTYLVGSPHFSLALIPLDLGLMPQDPNGRYRSETLSNGTTVCRDYTTGQFATKSLCGPRVLDAASADLLGAIGLENGKSVGLGAGYRVGKSAAPYGVAVLTFGPLNGRNWHVRTRVGASFFDVALGASLRMN